MERPKAVNAYQNTIVDRTVLVININNMYQFDSGYAITYTCKSIKTFQCTVLPVCIVAVGIVHNTRQCIDMLNQLALDQNNYQSDTHSEE